MLRDPKDIAALLFEIERWNWVKIVEDVNQEGYSLLVTPNPLPPDSEAIRVAIERSAKVFGLTHCIVWSRHLLFYKLTDKHRVGVLN
jgi:hypothetical protein